MTNRDKILQTLMLDDMTANQLHEITGIHLSVVRNTLDPLVAGKVVTKIQSGREVIYSLEPEYRLGLPTFLSDRYNVRTITHLTVMPDIYSADLNPMRARIRKLPIYVARMLHLGLKMKTLQENVDPDSDSYTKQLNQLKRELRAIRFDMEADHKKLNNFTSMYKQIVSDDEFWEPEVLAKHFTEVTRRNGRSEELVNRNQILSIIAEVAQDEL